MQAHVSLGWLDFLRVKVVSEESPEMDGADHVNRDKIPIRRPGSLDLKNGRLAEGHAAEMNGLDFHGVDGPRFPQLCFF
jgi:hypothetical protein